MQVYENMFFHTLSSREFIRKMRIQFPDMYIQWFFDCSVLENGDRLDDKLCRSK